MDSCLLQFKYLTANLNIMQMWRQTHWDMVIYNVLRALDCKLNYITGLQSNGRVLGIISKIFTLYHSQLTGDKSNAIINIDNMWCKHNKCSSTWNFT